MDSDTARTTRREISEQQLNAAIDIVALEMTAAEPSAALRARVLERIERDRRRPGLGLPRWAWAGVAAVMMVAAATGIWLTRQVQQPASPEGSVAGQRAAGPNLADATLPRPSGRAGGGPATTSEPPTGRTDSGVRTQRLPGARGARSIAGSSVGAVTENDALVPALADIEPLRFSAVEPAALHIPGVEVAPLDALPTIDIPALNPGSTDTQSADPKKEK
jgi:hypothetical protein